MRKMPEVLKRIEACRQDRLSSPDKGRQKLADTPHLFRETQNPEQFMVVPKVSSENRRYVPMGFFDKNTISTDLNFIIPNVTLYHFGVLTSNVHMAWMRAVCGRLEMRYRYSKDIVYNNFPWPDLTRPQSGHPLHSGEGFGFANAHPNAKTLKSPPLQYGEGDLGGEAYIIDKLRPVGKGNFTELKYNGHITIKNIPPEAHEYIVNGRSPLGWIIDQYQVSIDKDSGIKNDPNDWCREHNNPRYILELIMRVIEVSVRTVRIVKELPMVEV